MAIPSISPPAPNVVYKPIEPSSTDPSTSAKVQDVPVKEEAGPSSSHVITVIHPGDPGPLTPLLEGGAIAHANSEVVLSGEGKPPSVTTVPRTQSIFQRFCCCCRK